MTALRPSPNGVRRLAGAALATTAVTVALAVIAAAAATAPVVLLLKVVGRWAGRAVLAGAGAVDEIEFGIVQIAHPISPKGCSSGGRVSPRSSLKKSLKSHKEKDGCALSAHWTGKHD